MKKAMIALIMTLSLIKVACAYEIEGNPDRKLSLGFNYNRSAVKGDFQSGKLIISDAGKLNQEDFVADIRIPLFSFLTLSAGGGYSKSRLDISFITNGDGYDLNGYNLSAGIRFYLP